MAALLFAVWVAGMSPAVSAQTDTTAAYEAQFRRALSDSDSARTLPGLTSPQQEVLRQARSQQRRVSRLASVAAEGLSVRPGNLDAILTALQRAAPDEAAAVGDQLAQSFPGYQPQIVARLGTSAIAAPAAQRASWSPTGAAPATIRPSRRAAQAAATAIARIAGDPGALSPAVAQALSEAPGEEATVLAALAQAYPGFAPHIQSSAGAAPLPSPATALAVTPVAPAPAPRDEEASKDPFDNPEADLGTGGISDPIESVNRAIFAFNDALDTVILRPVAIGYNAVMPDPAILAVRRFFLNLGSPVILANDLLQTDFTDAGVTLGRFAVNTTVGVLGLFDPAEDLGLERHHADFGQTLHSYGVGSGAYLMLPFFGPSNARDAVGKAVDTVTDPLFWLLEPVPRLIVGAVDTVQTREELLQPLDELKASSVDYYSAVRSAWNQNRKVELNKGRRPAAAGEEYDKLFDATLSGGTE